MKAPSESWTDDEVMQVIELYLVTVFGKMHSKNPDIIALADRLGRTNNSISMKMANLASLDKTLDRKGLSGATIRDRRIWQAFFVDLTQQAKNLTSVRPLDLGFSDAEQDIIVGLPLGKNIPSITNIRQGQAKFREMVLTCYDQKCAITGISHSELLVAGHIRSWALDIENRMNPQNGICFNRLHDKAFEDGLITIMPDNTIAYSFQLNHETKTRMKLMNDTGMFTPPKRFKPNPEFLEYHRDVVFEEIQFAI